jgi:hypothetical protein
MILAGDRNRLAHDRPVPPCPEAEFWIRAAAQEIPES